MPDQLTGKRGTADSWRRRLAEDLACCCHLSAAWRSKIAREEGEEGLVLPLQPTLTERFGGPYCPGHDATNEDLLASIRRLAEVHVIELDSARELILLPEHRRPFAGQLNLVSAARRLARDKHPEARVANEVFRLIRGGARLSADVISQFRSFSDVLTRCFETKTQLPGMEMRSQLLDVAGPFPDRGRSVAAFIELAIATYLVRSVRERRDTLQCNGRADFWYLLTQAFGLKLDIDGMEQLFRGAVPVCNPPGNTLLVRGGTGCGKTTLASNLAFEVASDGGVSLYLSFEQDIGNLQAMHASFGWTTDPDVAYAALRHGSGADDWQNVLECCREAQSASRGAFVVMSVAKDSFSEIHNWLDGFITGVLAGTEAERKLIVFDPLNAISVNGEAETPDLRHPILTLMDQVRRSGACALAVGEELAGQEPPLRFAEAVSDTVIRLGYKTTAQTDYRRRSIEIVKSRIFPCVRGDNGFVIRHGRGIEVWPSSASFASGKRGRHRPDDARALPSGIPGLDEMLGRAAISTGTITGIEGGPGSGKTALALAWLRSGTHQLRDGTQEGEAGLYLAFRRSKPNSPAGVATDDSKSGGPPFSRIGLDPEGLTGGRVLQCIDAWLGSQKAAGRRHFRVVLDDLSYLIATSALVQSDSSFVPAIIELVQTDRIGMLVCFRRAPETHEHAARFDHQLRSACDNLLRLLDVDLHGQTHTAITVIKSKASDCSHSAYGLVQGSAGLRVEPTFSLFTDVSSGKPRRISAEIHLHSETSLQQQYNRRLCDDLRDSTSIQVELKEEPFPTGRLTEAPFSMFIGETLRLLQIDEPNLAAIRDSDVLVIPPDSVGDRGDFLASCADPARRKDGYKALPYCLNLPFILCTLPKARMRGALGSWRKLADWVAGFEASKGDSSIGFDFPKRTDENFNCLFFEILLAESGKCGDDPALQDASGLLALLQRAGPETAELYWRLGHSAYEAYVRQRWHPVNGHEQNVAQILRLSERAACYRVWYTTATELIALLQAPGKKKMPSFSRLPGHVETLGSWYMLIPKSSAAPEAARGLCSEICKRDRAIARFSEGVGLPPYSSLYGAANASAETSLSEFALSQLRQAAEGAIVRSRIVGYPDFSSTLAFYLCRILGIDGSHDAVPRGQIRQVFTGALRAIDTCLKRRVSRGQTPDRS